MFEFPEDLTGLTIAELTELRANAAAALTEFYAVENPTQAQADEAIALAEGIRGLDTTVTARTEQANTLEANRALLAPPAPAEPEATPTEPVSAPEAVTDPVPAAPAEPTAGAGAPAAPVPAPAAAPPAAAPALPVAAALDGQRPAMPDTRPQTNGLRITAAPDVPGVQFGNEFSSFVELANAFRGQAETWTEPTRTRPAPGGEREDLRKFGLATIHKDFPADLILDPSTQSPVQMMEILERAIDQKRLPGENLVASAGWCAPSEQTYAGFAEDESTDGVLSVPEVGLTRGGIKYTLGPDWSEVYGNAEFYMTEAQAIAGSYTKPSFEIPCPTFTEARLDAAGQFVKVPILLEAAYPEIVARWMRGLGTSHVHVMNVKRIAAIQTALGTAQTYPNMDQGSLAPSLFDILGFVIERERAVRKWSFNTILEIVLPHWVFEAIRSDIANRNGRATMSVKDAEINELFSERKYAPQWVYGFQELPLTGTAPLARAYPNTFDVLIYKAGTFVVGTKNVITLQSVYDAASLAGNIYTGLFTEEGFNVMRMGYGGVRVTIPLAVGGVSGAVPAAAIHNGNQAG